MLAFGFMKQTCLNFKHLYNQICTREVAGVTAI